jgi:hypothetical protein
MVRALRSRVGFAILIGFLLRTANATTLVVFYDPTNGVILATHSSIATGDIAEVRQKVQRGIPIGTASAKCKLYSCGKYLVASTGIWGTLHGQDLTLICQSTARTSRNIDTFREAFELQFVNFANDYVTRLINRKEPPKINERMFTLAIAGFESGRSVLRYRVLRYTGSTGGTSHFNISENVSCPGSRECTELRYVAGQTAEIEASQKRGDYPKTQNPLQLAEQLVQMEIDAHRKTRFVLPPISVVQINGPAAKWFRGGLCRASR